MGEASGQDCTIMSSGESGAVNARVAARTVRKRDSSVASWAEGAVWLGMISFLGQVDSMRIPGRAIRLLD